MGGTTCPSPLPADTATLVNPAVLTATPEPEDFANTRGGAKIPVRVNKTNPTSKDQRPSWRKRPSDQLPGDAWLPEPGKQS